MNTNFSILKLSFFSKKLKLLFCLAVFSLLNNNLFSQLCTNSVQPTLCDEFGRDEANYIFSTPTSTNALLISSLNNKNIIIEAPFTINTSLSLTNCKLLFRGSGKILLVSGGNLNSVGSKYFSCQSGGWAGISSQSGSVLYFENNHVEDAVTAIEIAASTAQITILTNYFNRNLTDILVKQQVAANAVIVGNTFESTSPTVFTSGNSENGIVAQKSSIISVGTTQNVASTLINIFRNHDYGITGSKANITIRSSNFECNHISGINSYSGTLNIKGTSSLFNQFSRNYADILSDGSNLTVNYNEFRNCFTNNISSLNNFSGQHLDIGNTNFYYISGENTYSNTKIGILIDRPTNSSINDYISNNNFSFDPYQSNDGRTAIKVTGYPSTGNDLYITSNGVTIQEGGGTPNMTLSPIFDISVGQASRYILRENRIYTSNLPSALSNQFGNRWGFYLHNWSAPSSSNYLNSNLVQGNDANFDFGMCAFHLDDSGPWQICENITDKTFRGFHTRADCSTSVFGGNTIGDHQRPTWETFATAGLLLDFNSKLGVQGIDPLSGDPICRHNRFTKQNYQPGGAFGAQLGQFVDIANNRFYYDINQTDELPNPVNTANWFVPLPTCSEPIGHCGDEGPVVERLDDEEQNLLEYSGDIENVEEWEKHYKLLIKLLSFSYLNDNYPSAELYISNQINTSQGQYAQFASQLNNFYNSNASILNSLNSIKNEKNLLSDKVDSLDQTLQTLSDFKNISSSFFSYRGQLLEDLSSVFSKENDILDSLVSSQNYTLSILSNFLNESLPQNTTYESNYNFMFSLTLKKIQGVKFSAVDSARLRLIAAQCREEAGRTVDKAIDLLPNGDPAKIYSDYSISNNCDRQSTDKHKISQSDMIEVNVIPNPADNYFDITFNSIFTGSLSLYTMSGKEILNTLINEKIRDHIVIPNNCLPGVYVLIAIANDGKLSSKRINIYN